MRLRNLPLEKWMVVDTAFNGWKVVSTHASQTAAERERDTRNEGLVRRRYSACMAFAPAAERMGRSCGYPKSPTR